MRLSKKVIFSISIVFFVVAYVVYAASNSQNYFEGFGGLGGLGGAKGEKGAKGGKDKKKDQTINLVEAITKTNESMEDSLNMADNKNDYIDLLNAYKKSAMLHALDAGVNMKGSVAEEYSNLKPMTDAIDSLIEFVNGE